MTEYISGPSGCFRLLITVRGMAVIHEVKNESLGELKAIMASATGGIRFTEAMANSGDETLAWMASGQIS